MMGFNETDTEKNINSVFELLSGSVFNYISLDCILGIRILFFT